MFINHKSITTDMLNYYALHYHMKHSGVRFVIENIFESLKKYSKNMKLYLIYSNKHEEYKNEEVVSINNPLVDYDETVFNTKEELDSYAEKIKDSVKSQIDFSQKCVLHTHNITLMKNTTLGRALQFLADEQKENYGFLILVHVHDFAEDNRPKRACKTGGGAFSQPGGGLKGFEGVGYKT